MDLRDDTLVEQPLGLVEGAVKGGRGGEDLRVKEVEQRPELVQVVLEWGTREEQAALRGHLREPLVPKRGEGTEWDGMRMALVSGRGVAVRVRCDPASAGCCG
jgi:hypothetical protein